VSQWPDRETFLGNRSPAQTGDGGPSTAIQPFPGGSFSP